MSALAHSVFICRPSLNAVLCQRVWKLSGVAAACDEINMLLLSSGLLSSVPNIILVDEKKSSCVTILSYVATKLVPLLCTMQAPIRQTQFKVVSMIFAKVGSFFLSFILELTCTACSKVDNVGQLNNK